MPPQCAHSYTLPAPPQGTPGLVLIPYLAAVWERSVQPWKTAVVRLRFNLVKACPTHGEYEANIKNCIPEKFIARAEHDFRCAWHLGQRLDFGLGQGDDRAEAGVDVVRAIDFL